MTASDDNDSADPVIVPASELVDISHQLHQQLINLVVCQYSAFRYTKRLCNNVVLRITTTAMQLYTVNHDIVNDNSSIDRIYID